MAKKKSRSHPPEIRADVVVTRSIVLVDADGESCIMLGIPGAESKDPRGRRPDITIIDRQGRRTWSVFAGLRDEKL